MKRLLLLAALAALVFAASAAAATPYRTLVQGNHGKRVCALQWLLSGHTPSAYRSIATYRGKIDCSFGRKTAVAVWNMKWRLGYPTPLLHNGSRYHAGFELNQILLGKRKRPISWIALASRRQARINHATYAVTSCQNRVVGYALSQVGVHEVPWGSNYGPTVAMFQSVTGAYHAAWCVSFVQWALWRAHVGPIADRTAGAVYLRDWAYRRGLLRSRPERGTIAVWVWSEQHASIVTHVDQTGYDTVDGNWNNSVTRVHHSLYGAPVAFVYLPGCS